MRGIWLASALENEDFVATRVLRNLRVLVNSERTILLMFTLGGFGGATSLCGAEAMIDAAFRTVAPHNRAQVLQRDEAIGLYP